jgi:hypothetical protein
LKKSEEKNNKNNKLLDIHWSGEDALQLTCVNKSERAVERILKSLNYKKEDTE